MKQDSKQARKQDSKRGRKEASKQDWLDGKLSDDKNPYDDISQKEFYYLRNFHNHRTVDTRDLKFLKLGNQMKNTTMGATNKFYNNCIS